MSEDKIDLISTIKVLENIKRRLENQDIANGYEIDALEFAINHLNKYLNTIRTMIRLDDTCETENPD